MHEAQVSMAPVLAQPLVRWFFAAAFLTVMLAHIAVYVFFSLYLDALGYSKKTFDRAAVGLVGGGGDRLWFYRRRAVVCRA